MATSEDEVDKIKFSCLHKICFACVCRYFIHSDFQSFTIDGPLTARCPICKDKTTHIQWKDIDKVIKTSTTLRKEIIKDNCTSHNKQRRKKQALPAPISMTGKKLSAVQTAFLP